MFDIVKERHNAYFNLIEAMKKEGCPICRKIEENNKIYFETISYEEATNKFFRVSLQKTMGYCKKHLIDLKKYGSALPTAILFKDQLDKNINYINEKKGLVFPKGMPPCPACENEKQNESLYLNVFVQNFSKDDFREVFKRSDGVCFLHFNAIIKALPKKLRGEFIKMQKEKFTNLSMALDTFIKKFDYRNTEGFSEEEKQINNKVVRIL